MTFSPSVRRFLDALPMRPRGSRLKNCSTKKTVKLRHEFDAVVLPGDFHGTRKEIHHGRQSLVAA